MSVARFFGWTAARFVRSINPRETVMPRVWLITGASRGLGWALADAVVAAGHMLIATARNPSHLADLEQRAPDRVRAVSLNVTDAAAAERAIQTAVDAFGRLDVLVNNAGYGNISSIEETSLADSASRSRRTCSASST